MIRKLHEKALKKLKSINTLTLSGKTEKLENGISVEYKHQLIELGELTLILSGTIENFQLASRTIERTFLVISLHDQNGQEFGTTSKQNFEYKKELKRLITA